MKDSSRRAAIAAAVALAFAAAWAPPCTAQQSVSAARDSADVIAIEHEWIGNRDSLALDRILAPDFQHPVAAGVILDKKANIAWLVHHPVPTFVRLDFASLGVRIYGDAAVATGIVRATSESGAELSNNYFTDVFIRREGRWQAVSAEETEILARKR